MKTHGEDFAETIEAKVAGLQGFNSVILPVRQMLPISVFGLSLFWGWYLLTFYSPTLAPSDGLGAGVRLAMLLGMAIGAFVSSLKPRIYEREMTWKALVAAFALTLPTNVLGFFGSSVQIPAILSLAAWFLSGCAFALMLAIWARIFVISWRHDVGIYIAVATAVGAIQCLFAANLSAPYSFIAATLLPAFSLVVFRYVDVHAYVMTFESNDTPTSKILPPGSSFVIALYGVLFAVPVYVVLRDSTLSSLIEVTAALAIGALAYFAYGLLADQYVPFGKILRVLLPLSVCGFFALPFLPAEGQRVACLGLVAILACLDTANLATIIARSYEHSFPPSQLVAAGRIYLALGKAIGWAVCAAFLPAVLTFPHPSAVFLLALVLILALAVALVPPMIHDVQDTAPVGSPDEPGSGGRFMQRVSRTASAYGLSDREQEVLRFLAKGRHAQYISEALQISRHTAKTHIYHIYRKLNVSSLEELMDVVEHIENER
ncbi:MAG: LuxR C-terminal-related transcriptional regulator [Coriobacteriia bacterium]